MRCLSGEVCPLEPAGTTSTTTAQSHRLSKRIDLTAQTGQIHGVGREYGNRLDSSTESCSPDDLSADQIQGDCAARLHAHHAISEDGWRCHYFAYLSFPTQ